MTERQAATRLVVFYGLLVLCLFGVDNLINAGLRRIKTGGFGVSNRVMSGGVNAEIVISGSSRALTHYDSRIIRAETGRSTFNIGRNGSQTDMQVAYLKAYLQHNTPPKLLVHNLDLFSFVTSREIYDPAQYLPYLGEKPIYTAIRRIYPEVWKWKSLPLYGFAVQDMRFTWLQSFRGLAGVQMKEDHFDGFLPRHTQWTGDFESFRESHPDGVTFEIEPQGVRDLTEVAEICRKNGVPVLFVYSPEYHQMQVMERNRGEIFAKFREIGDRFEVPLWDFSHSAICRDRENFYNSQHLNAEGAAAFSFAFAHRLTGEGLVVARPRHESLSDQ